METSEQHLFADNEYQLVQASGGKRFANYIIDLLVFYGLLFGSGIVIGLLNPAAFDSLPEDDSLGYGLLDRLLGLILYGIYMFIVEALFKGKSLGKLITGTRAVNQDGSNLSVKNSFIKRA